ncbi:MAG: heparinase II/III family protein [Hyphomicrobiales bacterium]
MTTTFADKIKFARLFSAGAFFSILRKFHSNPLTRLRLVGPTASELLIAPQDISTADATRANDIYTGYFSFGGHTVNCGGRSPFEMEDEPLFWLDKLHAFGWLKHLRVAENSVSRTQARLFVDDWIKLNNNIGSVAWDIECTAKRVIAWLCHSPLLLEDCDHAFYQRFMRSLTRQVRFLRLTVGNMPAGLPRLLVSIALSYAAISMSGHSVFIRNSTKRLDRELKAQILPDGGHISRNPSAVITILALLMPLRQAIIARDIVPSDVLIGSIDRMIPVLRFFRMGDGTFGQFNGMGDTPSDLVATLFVYDDVGGSPVLNASHSGYQRLLGGDAVVLMDTGSVPAQSLSNEIHAGCLSFELSAERERIVINCGRCNYHNDDMEEDRYERISRSTAAHSTLSINEESSCRFITNKGFSRFIGTSLLSGPTKIDVQRSQSEKEVNVSAEHDGYIRPFGLKHQRSIKLSSDGVFLSGQDILTHGNGQSPNANNPNTFQIRFHLHPNVQASLSSPGTVELSLKSGRRWLFTCQNLDIQLDESVCFSDVFRARQTKQILLQGRVGEHSVVDWSFQQLS